jgi:pSer/pThr/pTyr-binding forkhead associated (FHA) protein
MGVLQHSHSGRTLLLAAHSSFGRSPDCTFQLTHVASSKEHSAVDWNGHCWEARDLGSTNHTYVDGEKLPDRQTKRLKLGSILRFGDDDEKWKLVDDRGPVAKARCVETGEERFGESNVLALPNDDDVELTIGKDENGAFYVENLDSVRRRVTNGERLTIAGQEWVLTLPPASPLPGTYKEPVKLSLKTLRVKLYVSRDEEDVRAEIMDGDHLIDLGRKACFCALHALARQRLEDQNQGKLPEAEHGWMLVKDLMRETGETETALNVSIKRIREEFKDAGVEESKAIIDTSTRRGKRRMNIHRVEIVRGNIE